MSITNTSVTRYHLEQAQERLRKNREEKLNSRYGEIIRIPGIAPFRMRLSDEDRRAYEKILLLEEQARKRAARLQGRSQ